MVRANANARLIRELDQSFNMRARPKFEKAVNFSQSYTQPVHRWFRYREGFSPTLMQMIRQGERVYDPFCGCGTALIEAARRDIEAVGTDVNPLAVFVATTKSTSYTSGQTSSFGRIAAAVLDSGGEPSEPPQMALLPKIFLPAVLSELLRLKGRIDEAEDPGVNQLLRLAWLSILEDCSNVFKEGNGLKYRYMRRAPGKYIAVPDGVWIPKYFGSDQVEFVRQKWRRATSAIADDLGGRRKRWSSPEVLEASCLEEGVTAKLGSVDTAIYSPPYANRFDYFEAFKVELWMGGFVTDATQLRAMRKRSMRNNLTVGGGATSRLDELEQLLALMDEDSTSVRMGIKETLRGYFEDVGLLARNLKRTLVSGGRSICVVGNSAYAGVLIPTDTLCALVFQQEGFQVETIDVARHLTVSPQQRRLMTPALLAQSRESIIVCTNS